MTELKELSNMNLASDEQRAEFNDALDLRFADAVAALKARNLQQCEDELTDIEAALNCNQIGQFKAAIERLEAVWRRLVEFEKLCERCDKLAGMFSAEERLTNKTNKYGTII